MSYYGPSFANIESGWYRKTTEENYSEGRRIIDSHWTPQCDAILLKYVLLHGTYFTAFSQIIMAEIDAATNSNLSSEARYYEYYLANRALEIPKAREVWHDSQKTESTKKRICELCRTTEPVVWTHPKNVVLFGMPPRYCDFCISVRQKFRSFWSEEIEKTVSERFTTSQTFRCDICRSSFNLDSIHLRNLQTDYVYPNIFTHVCSLCIEAAFTDSVSGTKEDHLSYLYELFDFTQKIPPQDFTSLLYLYRDKNSVLKLLSIFKHLRTAYGYKQEFGSFFSALVRAKILPDGSRRMTLGTMVEANDGHLCLSIVEKEIDDFLSRNRLAHEKEANYPESNFRTDWALSFGSEKIFIEYFGLMNRPDYAEKAKIKTLIAQKHNINLIELYPGESYAKKIDSVIYRLTGKHCN